MNYLVLEEEQLRKSGAERENEIPDEKGDTKTTATLNFSHKQTTDFVGFYFNPNLERAIGKNVHFFIFNQKSFNFFNEWWVDGITTNELLS